MILHNLKLAVRSLFKNKVQTIISVLGLALGIFSFSLFDYVGRTLVSNGYPNHERIGSIYALNKSGGVVHSRFYREDQQKLRNARLPAIEAVAAASPGSERSVYEFQSLSGAEVPYLSNLTVVDRVFLDVFSVRLLTGSASDLFRQPGSVVLSESLARKVYGQADPIGKTVKKEGDVFTIRGVMADLPPEKFGAEPVEMIRCVLDDEPGDIYMQIIPLLKKGVSAQEVNRQIEEAGVLFGDASLAMRPEVSIERGATGQNMKEMLMWSSVGLLVLMAGLVNFFSIIVGSFYNRIKELTLRKTIGGTFGNLFSLLFVELFVRVLLATALSLCLGEVLIPASLEAFRNMFPDAGTAHIDLFLFSIYQLQYFVAILAVCALVACVAIYRLQKMPAMQGIRGGSKKGGGHRVRNVMLGVQFFVSFLFLGLVAVLHVQYKQMNNATLPTFPMSEQQRTYEVKLTYPQLEGMETTAANQLANAGCVEEVLLAGKGKFSSTRSYTAKDGDAVSVLVLEVSPNFARFIHLPMVQGGEPADRQSVMISRAFSDRLNEEGSNTNFLLGNTSYAVSGVMEQTLLDAYRPERCLVVKPVEQPRYCYLKSKPGQEGALREHIDKVMRQWVPETLPLELFTFEQSVCLTNILFRVMRNFFLFFAFTCLMITFLGVYAAITLDTEKRQKEVAIRKINGASFSTVALLFGKLYFLLLLVASAFALPIVWLLSTEMLQKFPIRFQINNPLFWLCILMIVIALVFLIIGYRLYKVARLNPASIIKSE